LGNVFTVIQG